MALVPVTLNIPIFILIFSNLTLLTCYSFDVDLLSSNLLGFVNNMTNFTNIQNAFEKANGTFTEVNGTELVREFTESLQQNFKEKVEKLKLVKERAEQSDKPTDKKDLKKEVVESTPVESTEENHYPYPNMREDGNATFTINPTFSLHVPVNMNKSFVHVPTNIYAKSDAVLRIVEWTKTLDEVFIDNFNHSKKTLLYQYYGDHSGFLRIYPGNNNNFSKTIIDLYDCRRRPWYVQTTSSPKDLVIIIDLSGSMIGSNIGIAKIATASLIDTLEENDFFNVITVNKNVTYMEPCLKYLLQATKKNKETMKMLVQRIEVPKYELNHTLGLRTAFEILDSGPYFNRSYAHCNRAIMFITDGIESDYTEEKVLFEEYNTDKSTRVFTYLVGRKKGPDKKALIQMACENNGYFYKLETLGNVWDTVLEYLHVMSRPLVAEKDKQKAMYTPAYLDSTGIGMIMSISMGVFNDQNFMGVAGTDISIESLSDVIPHFKLGVFGHAFIITNNGFLVMHPHFRLQTGRLPSPRNILVEDLERSVDPDDIIRVKNQMINRTEASLDPVGGESFAVYFIFDNDRKLSITNAIYNYQPINDTEFTAGIVMSEYENQQFDYTGQSTDDGLVQRGIKALEFPLVNMSIPNITIDNYTHVQVSPWEYLNITASAQEHQPYSIKVYPTAAEILEYLKGVNTWDELFEKLPANFSTRLLVNLLTSTGIMAGALSDPWVPDLITGDRGNYDSLFIATAAGYSKYFTFSNTSEPYNRDVLQTPMFQLAIANPNAKIIFSAPYAGRDHPQSDELITVVAPIRKEGTVVAVTGMRFTGEIMKEHLENITMVGFDDENHACHDNATNICALLDQNGYVIASNLGRMYIGRFIGEQSGLLIDKLVEEGVLKEINLEDTQCDCNWVDHNRASANILLTPAKLILNGLLFLCQTLATIGIQASLFIISILRGGVQSSGANIPDIKVSCTKTLPFYLFQRDKIEAFNEKPQIKECHENGCQMRIRYIYIVPDTNLYYTHIDIQWKTSCADECRKTRNILKRTRIDAEHYCANKTEMASDKAQKYRRRPSTCYNMSKPKPESTANTIKITKKRCGGADFMRPPTLGIFLIVICIVMTS